MKHFIPCALALSIASLSAATSANETLPTVSVTADFRAIEALKSASSVSVIEAQTISRRDAKYLDEILNTTPNVNFSAGASRGRFIQLRGIGERSQFKDPLDASVGMLIDGIDYSGIGLASALFDVQQVEVLRGPQGTQFGSSALAGMISIQSNEPTEEFSGKVSAGAGSYDSFNTGLVLNGAIADNLLGRIAIQKNVSDGYITNNFLNRDDTNNIDEGSVKAQLKWQPSDELTLALTTHYIDADNGYNGFSLENSRSIPTDQPGHDRQKSKAGALKINWTGHSAFELQSTLAYERSELAYGFDWDWTNIPASGTQGGENNARERDAVNFDLRLLSTPESNFLGAQWVAGMFAAKRDVQLNYDDSWYDIWGGGPWISTFDSTNDTQRLAGYGELSWSLSDLLTLSSGLRLERINNDYKDSAGVALDKGENQWGGNLTLEYTGVENTLLYATISRGYKTAGVNGQALGKVITDPSTPDTIADFLLQRGTFDSETLINYELGLKGSYLENTLSLSLTAFYMDRQDMQTNSSVLFPPSEWRSYIDNVDNGHNSGIELETQWLASDRVVLFAAVGLLETKLGDLTVVDVDTDAPLKQSGRDQAHAPSYQFNLGATVNLLENLALTVEVDGKDSFYFSNGHNDQSRAYELVHMNLAYEAGDLAVSLWARNLTNEDYQTRGFYFDNTGSGNQAYHQLGEPRIAGVSGSYSF